MPEEKKNIDDVLEDLIDKPKSVSSPSGSVTNISISEAIAADKHNARKKASINPFAAIQRGVFRGPSHYGT